jgi:hypothetical protein
VPFYPALKYSTAVPVIFLSALKYHVLPDKWTSFYRPLWLISSVINSLYSFYWDISRDWDLRCVRLFELILQTAVNSIFFDGLFPFNYAVLLREFSSSKLRVFGQAFCMGVYGYNPDTNIIILSCY